MKPLTNPILLWTIGLCLHVIDVDRDHIEPGAKLWVDHPSFTPQRHMQTQVSAPYPGIGQIPESEPKRCLGIRSTLIVVCCSIELQNTACSPCAYSATGPKLLDHGYNESFNDWLRDEVLNGEISYTIREAKVLVEHLRNEYNRIRPHSSLGYKPPVPETILDAIRRVALHPARRYDCLHGPQTGYDDRRGKAAESFL